MNYINTYRTKNHKLKLQLRKPHSYRVSSSWELVELESTFDDLVPRTTNEYHSSWRPTDFPPGSSRWLQLCHRYFCYKRSCTRSLHRAFSHAYWSIWVRNVFFSFFFDNIITIFNWFMPPSSPPPQKITTTTSTAIINIQTGY